MFATKLHALGAIRVTALALRSARAPVASMARQHNENKPVCIATIGDVADYIDVDAAHMLSSIVDAEADYARDMYVQEVSELVHRGVNRELDQHKVLGEGHMNELLDEAEDLARDMAGPYRAETGRGKLAEDRLKAINLECEQMQLYGEGSMNELLDEAEDFPREMRGPISH